MLARQRLEFTDFSAGITENFVPGKPNAYARADNLLITRDAHLETRPGSQALSDTLYVLPALYQRVGALFNFYNDTALLAQSGQGFYYQTGSPLSWASLLGPTGGNPFQHNDAYSRVASAQWRQHLYLASDSGDSPQVFYFDNSGTPQFRTAGLPRPVLSPVYPSGQLFAQAVLLAQALTAILITHFGDSVSHIGNQSSAALSALTLPTTVAQLITYIGVLKTQFNLHITDAQASLTAQVYHIQLNTAPTAMGGFPTGRYAVLNQLASTTLPTPTEINSCVATLNDLVNRYNFHTYSTLTHKDGVTALSSSGAYVTNQSGYGKNKCSLPTIPVNTFTIDGVNVNYPVFSGQLGTFLTYVNAVKREFNFHIGSGSPPAGGQFFDHNNADIDNPVTVPDAVDYFSSVVLLAHLEFFYYWHFQDAYLNISGSSNAFQLIEAIVTSGSPIFTSLSPAIGHLLIGQYFSQMRAANPWDVWTPQAFFADPYVTVTAGTTSTLTFSKNATAGDGVTSLSFRVSTSKYHWDLDAGIGSVSNPALYNARLNALDYSLQDLPSLSAEIAAILGLLKSHQLGSWVSYTSPSGQTLYEMAPGQTANLFSTHYTSGASIWPEAGVLDPNNSPFLLPPDQATSYFNTPPVSGSALYTFVWRYNYTSGGLTFENDSTPALFSQVSFFPSPEVGLSSTAARFPITLTDLPVLSNVSGDNWDTSNIKLDVYRTIANGQSFFLAGTVNNGTTTFVDSVVDSVLISNEPLYTTGGVLQNDQPPASKYLTILNETAYYGYVTDIYSAEVFPNRVAQSIQGAPYAAPAASFDDLDDQLTGLTNYNNYVVALCKTKLYRLEGVFDELGNGGIVHQMISPTVGNISHFGIVQTEYGIFFCGTNGIYWTDGFNLTRLTGELENTYNALIVSPTQRARINGVYDKTTRRIYWSFCSTPTSPEADMGYVLDLQWGVSEKASFTTVSAGAFFAPTAWVLYNNQLIRGTSYGFLFQHSQTYFSDQTPLLNQASTPSTQWLQAPIIYDFQSCATNFGSSQIKKWATRITYQGQVKSNLFLQINRKNDNTGGWLPLVPVRSITQCTWGDPGFIWGVTPLIWGTDGMIDAFRRTPAGSLRCDWMAVQFTNANGIIANSDTYGKVSTGARSGSSVVLTLPSPYQWPVNSKSYTIAFDQDAYTAEYVVTARTNQTLTISDPNSTAPVSSSNVAWQLSGIPYGERFNLTAYNIGYAPLSDEQAAFHGSSSSDGGGNLS